MGVFGIRTSKAGWDFLWEVLWTGWQPTLSLMRGLSVVQTGDVVAQWNLPLKEQTALQVGHLV